MSDTNTNDTTPADTERANVSNAPPRLLKMGDSDPGASGPVHDLQRGLRALGLLAVIDGDFGTRTRAAVLEFQDDHGLDADGKVGPLTWQALARAVPAEDPEHPAEFNTAGGEPTVVDAQSINATGWYTGAKIVKADKGRFGGAIVPRAVMIHTTDCQPGTMQTIVRSWSTTPGNGACAHFIIGATPADGVVQMVPITRNGNHAGGTKNGKPYHGDIVAGGRPQHPNTVLVGIELDNPGLLRRVSGQWVHPDTGRVIPDDRVYIDSRGKGWGLVTTYQFDVLEQLVPAILRASQKLWEGTTLAPNGTYAANGVPWAEVPRYRVIGHATLNPNNKTDPGPQVMDWIRARF